MDITSYILGMKAGSGSGSMHYVVVEQLPTTGEEGYIYLVPKSTSGTNNYYDEYMYINNDWEKIGDTEIDLSNYQELMQYAVVPNATASIVGKIIQYTGTTTASYTNGYFYQCVSDGETPATYSWTNINVDDIAQNIDLITINNGETTAEKELKYQQAIDNYKNGIETIIYFYYSGNNVREEQPIVLKIAKVEESNGTGTITFSGYYMDNGTVNWYGITYTGTKEYKLIINFTDYVYTSSSTQNPIKGYMITESSYTNILGRTNTQQWTPTGDYNPATKKYVDDQVGSINTILATLTTPSNGGV